MTATFLSLLTLVSFILSGHGHSDAVGREVDISVRMQQSAQMNFSYPLVL
jgi:hypothetical protein